MIITITITLIKTIIIIIMIRSAHPRFSLLDKWQWHLWPVYWTSAGLKVSFHSTFLHFNLQTWKTSTGPAPITTSLRSYLGSDDLDGSPVYGDDSGLVNEDWSEGATIFSQNFPDGLQAAAVKDEDAKWDGFWLLGKLRLLISISNTTHWLVYT